jgi:hypothetical protein
MRVFKIRRDKPLAGPRPRSLLLPVGAVWLVLALALLPAAPGEPGSKRRYLFIVDTSSSASRLAEPLQRTLFQLIESGIDGRIQTGDTFGLWTCNDRLSVDYPMQVWDNTDRLVLAYRAMDHLKKQRFSRQSRLEVALAGATTVIDSVKDLTVILLANPGYEIKGTPFDSDIIAALRKAAPELRQQKRPAIIGLLAENGRVAKWSLNSAEEMVSLPKPVPTTPVPGLVLTTIATNAPLQTNDSGAEPKLPAVVASRDLPSATNDAPAPTAVATSAATNQLDTNVVPAVAATPAVATNSPPAASTNQAPQVSAASTNTVPATSAADEKPAPRRAPIILTRDSVSLKSWAEGPTNEAASTETNAPPAPSASTPPPVVAVAVSNTTPLVASTNLESAVVSTAAPPTTVQTSLPPVAALTNPSPAEPVFDLKSARTPPPPPTPPSSDSAPWLLLVLGLAFAGVGALAAVFYWRSRASRQQTSLISQSITRNKM